MIYLTPGITASIWMSLRESGGTSSFTITLKNDMSGDVKTFNPVDLQPDNKWSRFDIVVGVPENLPSKVNLTSGMWSYSVSSGQNVLEVGKLLVEEQKVWKAIDKPSKTTKVLKR